MSFMKVPIAEDEASISRPVIMEVARQVMLKTNIPLDTRIVYRGQAESVFQPGSDISSKNSEVNTPQLSGDSQLYIEVVETPMLELITTEDTMRDNTNPCLFNDDKLGILVQPMKKQMEVIITFRFRSNSKTFATRWRNNIWNNVANQRDLDLHTVSYSYPFPPEFIPIIRYFHTLRENVAGYGNTFEEYFNDHMDQTLTRVSNLSGKNALAYKPETQTRILGLFDFQGEPEKAEKEGEGSTWTTEFAYKFYYEKPTHAFMRYPVAIHNQAVDKRLFGSMQKMLWEKELQYSKYTKTSRFFESDAKLDRMMKRHPKELRIPAHDTIAYTEYVPHTRTLFSALIELDTKTDILFNLRDLGDFGFNPLIMQYIEDIGYLWVTKPFECMLNISLYRNEHLTNPKNLVVDKDLNVRAVDGTDIRKVNRVRIGYYDNIKHISIEALKRWNNHKEALALIVGAGDTKATDIYRYKPRVNLTWLVNNNVIGENKNTENFFDMNSVMLRATVELSHIRAHRTEVK